MPPYHNLRHQTEGVPGRTNVTTFHFGINLQHSPSCWLPISIFSTLFYAHNRLSHPSRKRSNKINYNAHYRLWKDGLQVTRFWVAGSVGVLRDDKWSHMTTRRQLNISPGNTCRGSSGIAPWAAYHSPDPASFFQYHVHRQGEDKITMFLRSHQTPLIIFYLTCVNFIWVMHIHHLDRHILAPNVC